MPPLRTQIVRSSGSKQKAQLRGDEAIDSDIEFSADKGVILQSPDGTRYRLIVDDLGTVTSEAV